MPRRLWLSPAMLATGAALLVAAQLAGAAPERNGGIFKVGTTGASVQIDPQLSYVTTGWWLEYATAAKLYNYRPGGKLVPEVASGFKVSQGGRRYTFSIRKGFRFSDGTPVTAASFEYAIDRVANHDLASPGAQFIINPAQGGVDIVGALYVNEGNGDARQRCSVARQQADHHVEPTERQAHLDPGDAVLPGHVDQAAARPRGRRRAEHGRPALGRPVRVHAERRRTA